MAKLPISRAISALAYVFVASLGFLQIGSVRADDLEIVAEQNSVAPGGSVWLALKPTTRGESYSFWHAGLSGAGFEWTLPAGFTLGETLWPALNVSAAVEGLQFSFADDSWILQEIIVSADVAEDTDVEIRLAFDFADCNATCRREDADDRIKLITAGDDDAGAQNAALFAAARENALTFRRGGMMLRAGEGEIHFGYNMNGYGDEPVDRAFFLPFQPGLLAEAGALELEKFANSGFFSTAALGPQFDPAASHFRGILVMDKPEAGFEAHTIREPNDFVVTTTAAAATAYGGTDLSLLKALLFAFIGGIILNVMPCVFPVLAMKAMSFARAGSESASALRRDGWAYTAGIMISFLAVAGILMAIRAAGAEVGWGFQLQSPVFVFLLALLFFLISLNLLGVFEIGGAFQGVGQRLTRREGPAGAFFTGVLATVVATPCTMPFMAPAIAFALMKGTATGILVFAGLGLGLALPYLLISHIPAIANRFPKPGPWMAVFKEFLAFPMLAATVWLVWVLSMQAGGTGVFVSLGAFVLAALGIWLHRRLPQASGALRQGVAVVAIVATLSPAFVPDALPEIERLGMRSTFSPDVGIESIVYSEEGLEAYRKEGRPVFLHFWASWCIICLMHENLVYSTEEFQAFIRDNNVVFMEIDNTLEDPANMMLMESFGRTGQPLDIFFPGDLAQPAYVLPELYTTRKVISAMEPHL